jgi:NADPH-dependent glutamate synthase beta subunit-like oxidoreductase
VLVIGGGNVAIDVALSATRLSGVEEVYMACLEGRFEMPAGNMRFRTPLSKVSS